MLVQVQPGLLNTVDGPRSMLPLKDILKVNRLMNQTDERSPPMGPAIRSTDIATDLLAQWTCQMDSGGCAQPILREAAEEIDKLRHELAAVRSQTERGMLNAYQDIQRLQAAIRRHRDQRGDDRCWMDDEDLYRALPEGYEPPERDTAVELKNCELFILNRRNPSTVYESPEREIETLKTNLSTAMVVETSLRCSRRFQDDALDRLKSIGVKLAAFCARLSGMEDVPLSVKQEAITLANKFKQAAGIK